MEKNSKLYNTYVEIMKSELVPAMGCTEPIAVAYCAAVAREVLGDIPKHIEIYASGNIIKNVKSVIVPHSGGLRGLEAAAALGVLFGVAEKKLEVISEVTHAQELALARRMTKFVFSLEPIESDSALDLKIILRTEKHWAAVRITDDHTNITEMVKDGKKFDLELSISDEEKEEAAEAPDCSLLTVADIFDFANTVDLDDVDEILARQVNYNTAIATEGLKNDYGARIGKIILEREQGVRAMAKAMAAAGSDARMSGCDMPVIITSGSGNQGLTASLPIIAYAEHYKKSRAEMLRALVVSNLVTLHLKRGIGRLSAYCGAVSAGAGAGAGIAYLLTGDLRAINHTIVNALAISSGIVCDGAKASCAAKISMAVDAGIMGYDMFEAGCQFYGGDGLVSKGVENTIRNISVLGNEGMKETDRKIIEIMTEC